MGATQGLARGLPAIRRLVRGGVTSDPARAGALRVVAILTGLVASIALARLGGPDVRGSASALMAANLLGFAVVNLDLAQQCLRLGRTSGTQAQAFALIRIPWVLYIILGLPAGILILRFSEFAGWVVLGSMMLTLSMQAGVIRNGMSGPVALAWSAIGQQSTLAVGTMALYIFGWLTREAVFSLVVLAYGVAFIVAYRPGKSPAVTGLPPVRVRTLSLVAAGLPWQPLRIGQLLLNRLDTLIVFAALGAGSAGVYSVGLSLAALVLIIPTQISHNTLFLASQNRNYSWRGDSARAGGIALACSLPLVVGGEWALELFYGSVYRGAYAVLVASLPGIVAMSVVQVVTNHLRLTGRWVGPVVSVLLGVIFMYGALLALIPMWGLVGAAAASSIGAVIAALALVVAASRETEVLSPGVSVGV